MSPQRSICVRSKRARHKHTNSTGNFTVEPAHKFAEVLLVVPPLGGLMQRFLLRDRLKAALQTSLRAGSSPLPVEWHEVKRQCSSGKPDFALLNLVPFPLLIPLQDGQCGQRTCMGGILIKRLLEQTRDCTRHCRKGAPRW